MTTMKRGIARARNVLQRALAIGPLLLLALGGAGSVCAQDDSARIALPGHTFADLSQSKSAAAAPAAMTLTLVLRRDDEAGFQRYLHDVYDLQSTHYRQFLSAAQIADRFGPSQASVDRVSTFLATQRFDAIDVAANRMTITAHASRSDIENALTVHVGTFEKGARTFFANDADPSLPGAIAAHVQAVLGLSDLAQPHALNVSQPPAYYQCPDGVDPQYCDLYGPLCAIYAGSRATGELLMDLEGTGKGPRDYVKSYNAHNKNVQDYYAACLANQFPRPADMIERAKAAHSAAGGGVPWLDIDGSGQTVGLVEFDESNDRDVINYLGLIGAPANQIANLSEINLGAGASFGGSESEVLLDIDTVMSLAPAAHVVIYSASFHGGGTFQTVFNRMITDGVDVISNSWAYCEDQTTLADVQSIESILQTAAAAGISVFSGSGDSGSTCLDGAANVVAVPASSPSATAVGGTSLQSGAGAIHAGETWWDGSTQNPPGGQGGFGVSRYFARPAYQSGFTTSTMRSIPDIAAEADPVHGMSICQGDAGGCPTGLLYGGTSMAAPIWASFTALLNQARGSNLGFANAGFYPLAASAGFHSAASMGSDFAHVGLGSPNLSVLNLLLQGATPGPASALASELQANAPPVAPFTDHFGVAADGSTPGFVVVTLRDADGNTIAGKTVSLAANAGHHATITPVSQSTRSDGIAFFRITDATVEELTFTATDTTDNVVITQQAKLPFIGAPATGGGLTAFPTSQEADGTSTSTITVTLRDALARPSAGKRVLLAQDGHSLILGDNPVLTAANGEALFHVSNQATESVTYTAVDASDGNLAVPASTSVAWSNGVGCGAAFAPQAAPGYKISLYASGFPTQNGVLWGGVGINGCVGVGGVAFGAGGHLYASDYVTGDVYDVPPGGATVTAADRITPTPLGPSLGALTVGNDGQLYGARVATTGDFTTGAVLRIDTATGVATPVSSNITCPFSLATDPLSGDVFATDGCFGNGSDNAFVSRIANPGGASPSTSFYAETRGSPNGGMAFAPDGTLYVTGSYISVVAGVDRISATSQPQPAVVQHLDIYSTFALTALGTAPGGGAQTLIVGGRLVGGYPYAVAAYDMTLAPPVFSGVVLEETGAGAPRIVGPDGCLYLNTGVAIYRLANADDSCPLASELAPAPSLVLNPNDEPPVAAQGMLQYFSAVFPHNEEPLNTPVTVIVDGANTLQSVAYVGFDGRAVFRYVGRHAGEDTLVAYATIEGTLITSNRVKVTWTAGRQTTFMSVDQTPASGTIGATTHAVASLVNVSADPASPVAGVTISFDFSNGASGSCTATTNAAGVATCDIAPTGFPVSTLTASFAGDGTYLPASASTAFHLLADSIFANGFEVP